MSQEKLDITKIMNNMTLEQKAALCSGKDFWTTKEFAELGIPSIAVSDGPHGLRKENNEDESLAVKLSYPATAFPPAVTIASSWNPELAYKMGQALGDQCIDQDVSVILGPGTNIKRSPLCGRNFEYLSEDPYLAGKISRQYIEGVQSKNVGTSLKHFCANNQEKLRMTISAYIDERTLREIYLAPFEEAVKAQPWTVMCAYNRLNGVYASDNKKLLNDILRDEWGFKGIVVSDWNAVNDRVAGIRAGLDLEMPNSGGENDKLIVKAVKDGSLSMEELDKVVKRMLEFVFKCHDMLDPSFSADYDAAHNLARDIAQEAIVLLKNDDKILPWNVKEDEEFAVIGNLAKNFRYQGAGSSLINPYKLEGFNTYLDSIGAKYKFAQGYNAVGNEINQELFDEAVEVAKSHKNTVLFIGLTDDYESEGYDRSHMDIPAPHVELVKKITEVNPNVTVVLLGGSPVEMPWIDNVKCLVNAYLPGEAGGEAIYNIITGKVNPSGKLAETYPIELKDCASFNSFPMGPKSVEYREGIYVGYRYYDTANKNVRFPFGYGLSYTTFEYSNLKVDGYKVSYTIKNTGDVDGAEVSQIYVKDNNPIVFKAAKELKGFNKTFLKAGESKTVEYELNERSFAFFNTKTNSWYANDGEYTIMVGRNVNDIELEEVVNMKFGKEKQEVEDYKTTCPAYYNLADLHEFTHDDFQALYKDEIQPNIPSKRGEFDRNTTIDEMTSCIIGKLFVKLAPGIIKSQVPDADATTMLMIQQGMLEMPMRGFNGVTSGLLSNKIIDGMILWGNKHRLRGFFKLIAGAFDSIGKVARSQKERRAEAKKMKEINKAKKEAKKAQDKLDKAQEKQDKKDSKESKKADKN